MRGSVQASQRRAGTAGVHEELGGDWMERQHK